MQADSEERDQIDLQVSLIDLKARQKVDVYDIAPAVTADSHKTQIIGIKETAEVNVGTDTAAELKDWYYSDLFRVLIESYYRELKLDLPPEIHQDYDRFDFGRFGKRRSLHRTDLARNSTDGRLELSESYADPFSTNS